MGTCRRSSPRSGQDRRYARDGGRGGVPRSSLCNRESSTCLPTDRPSRSGSLARARREALRLALPRPIGRRPGPVNTETIDLGHRTPQAEEVVRPTRATRDVVVRIEQVEKRFPVRRSWKDLVRHPLRREWHEVLRSVSIDVHRGEFFGLLGPNGAGKTTLFKALATLVAPDAGRIEVAGYDLRTDARSIRRVLCPVIADERSLNWRLSARENLRVFAGLYRLEARERTHEIGRVLEVVGLEEAAERPAGQFSSGMKQRLLIARALLARPEVLLLDEPTRSLDPVSARDFRRFLRDEVVGQQGCTVLLATHSADEAFGLCDRLAVLDRGRLVAQGTAADLASKARQSRYRIVVPRVQEHHAVQLLQAEGGVAFSRRNDVGSEWRSLEGNLPAGTEQAGQITRLLVGRGIDVGEVRRIDPSLADILERLVAEGAAA
ncbi:MAG: ATP-binding cassette domain-containing protein [Gemmatimonas sp.]|nr:ATP-binding cassette domain-containing protein [Gemmatimonas sp.]